MHQASIEGQHVVAMSLISELQGHLNTRGKRPAAFNFIANDSDGSQSNCACHANTSCASSARTSNADAKHKGIYNGNVCGTINADAQLNR